MHYSNRYDSRDEVKVAVLADELRANAFSRVQTSDIICGCVALLSVGALFLAIQ